MGSGRFVIDNLSQPVRVVFRLLCHHLEDCIAQSGQEAVSAHDFYTLNATAFKSASDAMVVDLSKMNMGDFLGEAKKVMVALDVLQQVHPFVGGVFTTCRCFRLS
jgi:hypothetical protein